MTTIKTRKGDRLIIYSGRKGDRQIVHTQILDKGSVEVFRASDDTDEIEG